MCRHIVDLTTFEKTEDFDEKDIFDKIKEIIEQAPEESPSFALSSMVMDGFTEGGSICKVTKDISLTSEIPSLFSPL